MHTISERVSEFTTKEDILGISLQFLEDHPLEVSPGGTN
jgi:hypothetical protein